MNGGIASLSPVCSVAAAWAGDGRLPSEARIAGTTASRDAALDAAGTILQGAAGRLLVVLAPGLPTATYGEAVAIADQLGAMIETPHGAMAAEWVLAGQRRGRVVATLGEVRHRADLVVYWGVDPAARWPRYAERFGEQSTGLHVTERSVVSVSIGVDRAPATAALQLTLAPSDEVAAIGAIRAALRGSAPQAAALPPAAAELLERFRTAAYISLVTSAESGDATRQPAHAEALLALAQQLNGPDTRCTITLLRTGGNAAGIESLLTWQTGFPLAVDFGSGAPTYAPSARGSVGAAAALIVGDLAGLPESVRAAALAVPHVVIGPRASVHAPAAAASVDTGLGGLHESGTAYRMDDVPLPIEAPLAHPHPSAGLLAALRRRLIRAAVPA